MGAKPEVAVEYWFRDDLQFPRLLAALGKAGLTYEQVKSVEESTGLTAGQIADLLGRADKVNMECSESPEHIEDQCISCRVPFSGGG